MIRRRRPGWGNPSPSDRALRLAVALAIPVGLVLGYLSAPFGIFPR